MPIETIKTDDLDLNNNKDIRKAWERLFDSQISWINDTIEGFESCGGTAIPDVKRIIIIMKGLRSVLQIHIREVETISQNIIQTMQTEVSRNVTKMRSVLDEAFTRVEEQDKQEGGGQESLFGTEQN